MAGEYLTDDELLATSRPSASPSNVSSEYLTDEELLAIGNTEKPRTSRTMGEIAGDVGVTALKGAVGLPQAIVGVADIPTGGHVGKALEDIGYRPNETQKTLDTWYSPAQQEANRNVHNADGFVDTMQAAIENPSAVATTIGESIPQMLGGAGVARGLMKGGQTVGKAVAPWLAGAAGEGVIGAGSAEEGIRGQSPDGLTTPAQSLAAAASGAGTAVLGAVGGKLSQKMGLADVDTMLAQGGANAATAKAAKTGFVKQVIGSGISEGAFEELPQSVQEQMWQNFALGKPLADGVGNAAALGLLSGSAMGVAGGGYNAMAGKPTPAAPSPAILGAQNVDELIVSTQASVAPRSRADVSSSIDAEPVAKTPHSDDALLNRLNVEGKPIQHGNPLASMPETSSGFNPHRIHPVTGVERPHNGYDYPAAEGTPVQSTAEGIVKFAGQKNGYGNVVIIQHSNGEQSLYGHLHGITEGLKIGQQITQGQVIGGVGATGQATGNHLHYERIANGTPYDYLKAKQAAIIARQAPQPAATNTPRMDLEIPVDMLHSDSTEPLVAGQAQPAIEQSQPTDLNVELPQELRQAGGQNAQDATAGAHGSSEAILPAGYNKPSTTQEILTESAPETGSAVGIAQEQALENGTTSQSADPALDSGSATSASDNTAGSDADGILRYDAAARSGREGMSGAVVGINGASGVSADAGNQPSNISQSIGGINDAQAKVKENGDGVSSANVITRESLPSRFSGQHAPIQPDGVIDGNDPLRPLRTEILKYKGEGKTKTGSKVIYDATDRLKAITEDTGTSLAAQQIWFNSKRKILAKNGDTEVAALFEQVAGQIKAKIAGVKDPVATVAINTADANRAVKQTAEVVGKNTAVVVAPNSSDQTKLYSDMSYDELNHQLKEANKTNNSLDMAAITKHYDADTVSKYKAMSRKQQDDWWNDIATEEAQNESSMFKGVNEETIKEHRDATTDFDTSSPAALGRSIALATRDFDKPGYKDTPEYTKVKNALKYSAEQGWNDSLAIDGMRARAAEWAGDDAPELFGKLFADIGKSEKSKDTDTLPDNSNKERAQLESKATPKDEISRAKEHLTAAGIKGNERLAAIAAVRSGANTAEDVAEAHRKDENLYTSEERVKESGESVQNSVQNKAPKFSKSASTINVNGIERSRLNSNGKPIANTDEALRNFWEWFGESKVVDEDGRPLVVYHGTDNSFDEFSKEKVKSKYPYSFGLHFTTRTQEASVYADSVTNATEEFNPKSKFAIPSVEGGNVIPVYLKAAAPLEIDTDMSSASMEADTNRYDIMAKLVEAKESGSPYDSVIIKRQTGDEYDGQNIIVFDPNQVKSAIGNNGDFNKSNNSILKSKSTPTPNTHTVASATSSMLDAHTGKIKSVLQAMLDNGKAKVVTAEQAAEVVGEDALYMTAWHGSPHDHNGFSMDKVGTGEGAQAYGHGLYFAANKDIAEYYQKSVTPKNDVKILPTFDRSFFDDFDAPIVDIKSSIVNLFQNEASKNGYLKSIADNESYVGRLAKGILDGKITRNGGRLYQVELAPDQDDYLLWDKPLSEQSEKVRAAITKDLESKPDYYSASTRYGVEYFYKNISHILGSDKAASDYLHSLGIRGIKYLDGSSRNRPLKDIKRAFLDELPEDAEFDEVMELVGTGKFSAEQDAVLRALEADDWLGYDYPAQAISAALSKNLAWHDPSPELSSTVAELSKDATHNYVIFNDQDVKITAKFAKDGQALAFYNPHDGITYFVADHIPKGYTAKEWEGLVMHEIATHALQLGRDTKEFKSILNQIELMRKAGNKTAIAAFKRVPADTKPEHVNEEVLAYLLQESPQLSVAKRFFAWLRNAIRAIGKSFPTLQKMKLHDWAASLNESDLRFMAESALRNSGRSGVQNESDAPQFSKSSQTDTPAFKKWFEKSKVVDADGRPLVVYHGTDADFSKFDIRKTGQNHYQGQHTFSFTSEASSAGNYAKHAAGKNGNPVVMPVYLSLQNPFIVRATDRYAAVEHFDDNISANIFSYQADGYDGILIKYDNGMFAVAFNPSQIKSSTGNNGNFSKSSNSILFSKSNPAPKSTVPTETSIQSKQRVIQDKFNRFKVLQDWLKDNGLDLSEEADVYLAETLMSGRVSTRKQDFREKQMAPLIKKTQKAGISMEDIGDFLKMQHAPEANKRARLLHDDPDATAFGVTDKEAKDALDDFKKQPSYAELKALADEWRGVTNQTKKILLDSGIISPEMAKAWEDTFDVYVPVKGKEESTGTGKGLNVNGKQKARLGHGLRDEAILENIWRDHERAISLDEKNLVGKALIRFALEAKNDDIITVEKPVKRQLLKAGQSSYMVTLKGNDIAAFQNESDARQYVSLEVNKGGKKADFDIVKTTDPARVMMQASPMLADNEVNVYVGGHTVRIQINDEIAARAYTNLGVEHLNAVLSAGREFNSWLSKAYTGYSPDFILTNPIRDAIQGSVTLTAEYGTGMAAKIFSNYPKAAKELVKHFRKPGSSSLVTDYRANGGSTGAAYLSDLERIGDDMQAAYNEYAGITNTYQRTYAKAIGESKSAKAAHMMALIKSGAAGLKKIPVIGHSLRLMERINSITENALRVATYDTLVKSGVSKGKAAAQAKNLMNFNRKGEISNQVGAMYLFFNPSVQGQQVMYRALFDAKHKGQARALSAMMVLSAIAISAMNRDGGDDDEEKWKNTPSFVKDGNIVYGWGDYQVTSPLPYGYRIFHTLGNVISDYIHGEDGYKLGIRMASSVFENFSPVGNPMEGERGVFQLLPTIPKMALGPSVNENSFGQGITPERFNDAKPDSQLMYRATKGTLFADTAEALNDMSGGTMYRPGTIDVSPETLKFWVTSITGSAGHAAMDVVNVPSKTVGGVTPSIRDIPVIRRFVREVGIADSRAAFWDKAKEAKKAADELGEAMKHRDGTASKDIIKEHKDLIALSKYAEKSQEIIKLKRDEVDRIRNDSKLSPLQKEMQTKKVENEEEAVYNRFIHKFAMDTKERKQFASN